MENTHLKNEVINYYNSCWLNRFEAGHNPNSLAMHLGFFEGDASIDNDLAKNNMNQFIAELILKHKASETIESIADFGCGVGGTCFYLAHKFPHSSIVGANVSKEQIQFASKQAELKKLDQKLQFLEADYAHTHLESSSVDVVLGIESFCHAASKKALFNETNRVLKPGGLLLVLDYVETREPETKEEHTLLNNFRKGWAVEKYIYNEKELAKTAGFSSLTSYSIVDNVAPGILKSYNKAMKALENTAENTFSDHLNACIALKKLVDLNLIDYKVILAKK